MKKIYTLLLAALVASVCSFAGAVTVTFKANVSDVVETYDGDNYVKLTTEGVQVTPPSWGSSLSAAEGWKITDVKVVLGEMVSVVLKDGADDSSFVDSSLLLDGSTVDVTVVEASSLPKPVLNISGPAGTFYVQYNYEDIEPNDEGVVSIEDYSKWNTMYIYAKEGNQLSTVTNETTGANYTHYNTYCSIYLGSLGSELVQNIKVTMLDASLLKHFNVKVEGESYKINMTSSTSSDNVYLYEDNDIAFMPGTEYYITNWYYASELYKVTLNGVDVEPNGKTWTIIPQDGDQVVIYTEYPPVDVPVTIEYGEGIGNSIVKEFRINNQIVDRETWTAPGFVLQAGKGVDITLNKDQYTDLVAKVNGTVQELTSYSAAFNFTPQEGTEYTLYFSGTPIKPYTITVECAAPGSFKIGKGWSGEYYDIPADAESFNLAVYPGESLKFEGAENYILGKIYVDGTEASNPVYPDGDCVIEVETSELVRDMTAVVYWGPGSWNYKNFTLSDNNYDARVSYEPAEGYNFYKYGSFDTPFYVSGYPQPVVYLNDEELTNNYGSYSGLENYKEGDVIKVFIEAPASHSVNYEIAEGAAVAVVHDHVRAIENPANHTVFAGTQVHLIPVTTLEAAASALEVTVNDAKVEADAEGKYGFTVNENTTVKVAKVGTGVDNIAIDNNAEGRTYNLQGVEVSGDRLPAGIYIVNGKKTIRK